MHRNRPGPGEEVVLWKSPLGVALKVRKRPRPANGKRPARAGRQEPAPPPPSHFPFPLPPLGGRRQSTSVASWLQTNGVGGVDEQGGEGWRGLGRLDTPGVLGMGADGAAMVAQSGMITHIDGVDVQHRSMPSLPGITRGNGAGGAGGAGGRQQHVGGASHSDHHGGAVAEAGPQTDWARRRKRREMGAARQRLDAHQAASIDTAHDRDGVGFSTGNGADSRVHEEEQKRGAGIRGIGGIGGSDGTTMNDGAGEGMAEVKHEVAARVEGSGGEPAAAAAAAAGGALGAPLGDVIPPPHLNLRNQTEMEAACRHELESFTGLQVPASIYSEIARESGLNRAILSKASYYSRVDLPSLQLHRLKLQHVYQCLDKWHEGSVPKYDVLSAIKFDPRVREVLKATAALRVMLDVGSYEGEFMATHTASTGDDKVTDSEFVTFFLNVASVAAAEAARQAARPRSVSPSEAKAGPPTSGHSDGGGDGDVDDGAGDDGAGVEDDGRSSGGGPDEEEEDRGGRLGRLRKASGSVRAMRLGMRKAAKHRVGGEGGDPDGKDDDEDDVGGDGEDEDEREDEREDGASSAAQRRGRMRKASSSIRAMRLGRRGRGGEGDGSGDDDADAGLGHELVGKPGGEGGEGGEGDGAAKTKARLLKVKGSLGAIKIGMGSFKKKEKKKKHVHVHVKKAKVKKTGMLGRLRKASGSIRAMQMTMGGGKVQDVEQEKGEEEEEEEEETEYETVTETEEESEDEESDAVEIVTFFKTRLDNELLKELENEYEDMPDHMRKSKRLGHRLQSIVCLLRLASLRVLHEDLEGAAGVPLPVIAANVHPGDEGLSFDEIVGREVEEAEAGAGHMPPIADLPDTVWESAEDEKDGILVDAKGVSFLAWSGKCALSASGEEGEDGKNGMEGKSEGEKGEDTKCDDGKGGDGKEDPFALEGLAPALVGHIRNGWAAESFPDLRRDSIEHLKGIVR